MLNDETRVPQLIFPHINKTKRIDMKISVDITGIANCPVRETNGNLLPGVWTRNSVCNKFENATLLTREALQKHLQNFIDAGVKENLEILQKVKDPALLVDWVVRTAEYWEKRYAEKRNEKYDISQTVLSVMFEVVFDTVAVILDEADFSKVLITMEKKILDELKTNQKCVLGLRLRLPPRPDRDTLYAEPRARTWGGKWDKTLGDKALRAPGALLVSVLGNESIVNNMHKVRLEPAPSRTLAGSGVSSPTLPNGNA